MQNPLEVPIHSQTFIFLENDEFVMVTIAAGGNAAGGLVAGVGATTVGGDVAGDNAGLWS